GQLGGDPPSDAETGRWRVRHTDIKHFSRVHASHANFGADRQAGKIDELGVILNTLSECLTPVADQEHAGAEEQQAADNEETDTYIFVVHLANAPKSICAQPHSRCARLPRLCHGRSAFPDREPRLDRLHVWRHAHRASRLSQRSYALPFAAVTARRSRKP